MNAMLSKILAIFLASFVAGFGGCAGAFAGFRAIGFIKPKADPHAMAYKYMAEKQIDGFDDYAEIP